LFRVFDIAVLCVHSLLLQSSGKFTVRFIFICSAGFCKAEASTSSAIRFLFGSRRGANPREEMNAPFHLLLPPNTPDAYLFDRSREKPCLKYLRMHRETFGYATQVPTNAKDKRVAHLIGKSAENGRRIAIGVLEKIDVIRGLLYFLFEWNTLPARNLIEEGLDLKLLADCRQYLPCGRGEGVNRHRMSVLEKQANRSAKLRLGDVYFGKFH
jgi:hypothetical protein